MMIDHVSLILPEDEHLLQAAGRVAFAHGQLEHVLRMTIKTLSGLSINEVLDATNYTPVSELRRIIARLAKQKMRSDLTSQLKVDALLQRANNLSRNRNDLIHRPTATGPDGTLLAKDEEHSWGPSPTAEKLNKLADDISSIVLEINGERLHGFIKAAVETRTAL